MLLFFSDYKAILVRIPKHLLQLLVTPDRENTIHAHQFKTLLKKDTDLCVSCHATSALRDDCFEVVIRKGDIGAKGMSFILLQVATLVLPQLIEQIY